MSNVTFPVKLSQLVNNVFPLFIAGNSETCLVHRGVYSRVVILVELWNINIELWIVTLYSIQLVFCVFKENNEVTSYNLQNSYFGHLNNIFHDPRNLHRHLWVRERIKKLSFLSLNMMIKSYGLVSLQQQTVPSEISASHFTVHWNVCLGDMITESGSPHTLMVLSHWLKSVRVWCWEGRYWNWTREILRKTENKRK